MPTRGGRAWHGLLLCIAMVWGELAGRLYIASADGHWTNEIDRASLSEEGESLAA